MFDVIAPSKAFSVDANGCACVCGQRVRYPNKPDGTTVALKTYACAPAGTVHKLPATLTFWVPLEDSALPVPVYPKFGKVSDCKAKAHPLPPAQNNR